MIPWTTTELRWRDELMDAILPAPGRGLPALAELDLRSFGLASTRRPRYGVDGARVPLRDRHGKPITFGHYRVRRSGELRFPRWSGTHYLDYGSAGNPFHDPARFGRTPLVAVNEGSQDLLLGPSRQREVFRVGPAFLPLPLYWALRYEGPVQDVIRAGP
jgi:hypothetical protein